MSKGLILQFLRPANLFQLIAAVLDKNEKIRTELKIREINFESCKIKQNFDCNYTFPINLAQNRIPFGAKSIGKVYLYNQNMV